MLRRQRGRTRGRRKQRRCDGVGVVPFESSEQHAESASAVAKILLYSGDEVGAPRLDDVTTTVRSLTALYFSRGRAEDRDRSGRCEPRRKLGGAEDTRLRRRVARAERVNECGPMPNTSRVKQLGRAVGGEWQREQPGAFDEERPPLRLKDFDACEIHDGGIRFDLTEIRMESSVDAHVRARQPLDVGARRWARLERRATRALRSEVARSRKCVW